MAEEQVYAQLYQLDAQQKLAREVAEAQEKQKLINETLSVLDWQKQTREINKNKEKQLVAEERAMLKTQWDRELAHEKKVEEERYILNRERNKELIAHNAQEKILREQAELSEKQRDLILLNQQIEFERAVAAAEHEEKMKHRRETIEIQKFALQEAEDKHAYEAMIDKLVAQENAKQWNHREQQWDRED